MYVNNTATKTNDKTNNYFKIKMLDLPKDASEVDVYINYTLADTVDIVIKHDDRIIKYEIDIVSIEFNDDVVDINSSVLNLSDFFNKYQKIESTLLDTDNHIVKKHELTNYLEDYFNRKYDVMNLINKIQNIDNICQSDYILSLDDNLSNRKTILHKPIKELFEFYQFCRAYMYDEDTDSTVAINNDLKKKKRYIDAILNDRYAVNKLTEAITILENIKKKYNK